VQSAKKQKPRLLRSVAPRNPCCGTIGESHRPWCLSPAAVLVTSNGSRMDRELESVTRCAMEQWLRSGRSL
jgi:hypothetical protein